MSFFSLASELGFSLGRLVSNLSIFEPTFIQLVPADSQQNLTWPCEQIWLPKKSRLFLLFYPLFLHLGLSDNDDFTHRCGFRRQGVRLFHAFCNVLWKVESHPDLMRPTTHLKGFCTGANLILKIVILSFRFRSWKQNHTI